MYGDDGQDDIDDDDDDDDNLRPLVSPPDRASFELPRAPDIGSCNANLLSNVTPKINITIVPVILVVEKINKCLQ